MNTLINDDCVQGMSKLKDKVDLIFADPPFNIGYTYDVYDDRKSRQAYLDWSAEWLSGAAALLKDTGTMWLAIGDDYAAELKLLMQDNLNLTCRSWVIWYYTFGANCQNKFTRSHTHLFQMVKSDTFTFNRDEIRVPSARQLVYNDKRANAKGRLPDDTWILRPTDAIFNPEEDTWQVPRVCGTFKERVGWHGCQMPELVLDRIIRVSSNPGDVVLDPFVGSGTTLVVAKKLGRQYIGFEISADYCSRVHERLEATCNSPV